MNTGFTLSQYGDDTGHDTSYIYKTTDGGSSWNEIYKRNRMVFLSNSFINNTTGWIAAWDWETSATLGKILKTTDGGINFIRFDVNIYLSDIIFLDSNNGWGCYQRVYRTTNGGENWEIQLYSFGNSCNSIFFTDTLNGWVACGDGKIYSTVTGGINSINSNQNNSSTQYQLLQNYPNPFNPKTVIRYSLTGNHLVKLKVYDVLGNEVATLINENQNAGSFSVDFDGANLSSGIYFYKLTAGEFSAVKRMVLMK